MSVTRWLACIAVGVGLGVGGGLGAHALLPRSPYAEGVYVGGERLPPPREVGAFIDRLRAEVRARPVYLHYGEEFSERTYADLGVDLDISATMAQVERVAHSGSLADRVREARAAKRGEIDVPLVYRVDLVKARGVLEELDARYTTAPVDAQMDLKARRKIPDVPGRALDLGLSMQAVEEAKFDRLGGEHIVLTTRAVRAKVTTKDLVAVDVTKTLGSFETTFVTYGVGVGRSVNIARAAQGIDGTIIPPGQTISFNELVGPRTLERGFTWAPEIQGDELTTGVGGGTCQVSSTLFNAALFSALEVTERQSHSRPSSYAKLGLDATVVYGSVDLKIKNPFTFPVMIHASLPKPGIIKVELLGGDPQAEVSYAFGIGHVENFMRRITVKSHLKPGTRMRRQKGSRGMDVSSVVTIRWKDGRVEERTFFSGYRPAPEVYWVSPGYDEHELPPLPEHALGVEGRLYDEG